MPDLRVLTWNSNGGAVPRGAEIVAATNALTALYPAHPLQICVCQETAVGADSIQVNFGGTPPFLPDFIQPSVSCREHLPPPAQPYRVGVSRNYRMSYMTANAAAALNLVGVGGFNLVDLNPAVDPGVAAWIGMQGLGAVVLNDVTQCAANMRWPVYQQLNYAGGTVHFFTWHAPLQNNWLNANFSGNVLPGGALWESFQFFQHSNFYTNIIAGLGGGDVVIIAGDLNTTNAGLGFPNMFNNYIGFSNNLTHMLTYSPSPNLAIDQGHNTPSPNSPHDLVSARVRW